MLTDQIIERIIPMDKSFYLTHRNGLQLEVTPAGSLCWRYCYRYHGLMYTLRIWHYPRITIRQAINLRNKAYALVKDGINPVDVYRRERALERVKHLTWQVRRAEQNIREIKKRIGFSAR